MLDVSGIPLSRKMQIFSRRIDRIESSGPHGRREKLQRLAYRFGLSEATMYRWRRAVLTTGRLESRNCHGAQLRRVRDFFPRAARVLKLMRAGLSRKDVADVLCMSAATVGRIYVNADRLAAEIEKAKKASASQTHGNGPCAGGSGKVAQVVEGGL